MYSTKSINGIPIIQCNGRNLLGVWDRDWQYAKELCNKLNKLKNELSFHLEGEESAVVESSELRLL